MMKSTNIAPYLGLGVTSLALSQNENIQFSISGTVLIAIIALICMTLIIIVYRLTNKTDVVALVKAWHMKKEQHSVSSSISEASFENNDYESSSSPP